MKKIFKLCVILLIFSLITGCSNEDNLSILEKYKTQPYEVTDWNHSSVYKVVSIDKIPNTDMVWVSLVDQNMFPHGVTGSPKTKLPIGSEVKLVKINTKLHATYPRSLTQFTIKVVD